MFALLAWLATTALAFMIGRVSVAPEVKTAAAPTQPKVYTRPAPDKIAPPSSTTSAELAKKDEAKTYPRFTGTIPVAFQGGWDEIVTDKCSGREARYTLLPTEFLNFEIITSVERVKILSPNEIEIYVTGYDEKKNQFNDKIGFRLLDEGKTLTGTDAESNFYRRCPKQ